MRSLVYISTLFLLGLVYSQNILLSPADLELLDSYSSVSIATFTANPGLNDALAAETMGIYNSKWLQLGVGGSLPVLITGNENFYPAFNNTNPLFVSYDLSADTLVEISRIYSPQNIEVTDSIISPTPSLPIVVSNFGVPVIPGLPVNESAFVPTDYLLSVYNYSSTGVLNPNPIQQYQLCSLNPNCYNSTVYYNGAFCISDDGEYLLATYALGLNLGQGQIPGLVVGQNYVVMKISNGGATFTPAVTVASAPTNVPDTYSFPQYARMWPSVLDPNLYHIVIAEDSANFTNPLGYTAQVCLYVFHKMLSTLVRLSCSWAPQYIQGLDVDIVNNRVYLNTNHPDVGPSIHQVRLPPFNNPAVDKQNNLRALKMNLLLGTLTYVGGVNLNADGIQVRSSPDGSVLAVTSATEAVSGLFLSQYGALGPLASRYGPAKVTLYSVLGINDVYLKEDSASGASPLSFGLAWNPAGNRLTVGGQPTCDQLDGAIVGLRDVQLYSVTANLV